MACGNPQPVARTTLTPRTAIRNRLKLRQINLLAAIGQVGSLHQAASLLGVTQPAATRLLHELEDLVGTPLFQRTNRGLTPTDVGRLLIRHASTLVNGIDTIYEQAGALAAGDAGSLRIGISTGAAPGLVPDAVLLLKRETPSIDLYLQDGMQEDLIAALRTEALDVVVGRAPSLEKLDDLLFVPLYEERFSMICGQRNACPEPAGKHFLSQVVDYPWILPQSDTALRKTLDNQFVSHCGRPPTIVIESVCVRSNIALLESSSFLAVMPRAVASYYAARDMLRVLMAEVPNLSGTVGLMSLRSIDKPDSLARISSALQAGAKGLGLNANLGEG